MNTFDLILNNIAQVIEVPATDYATFFDPISDLQRVTTQIEEEEEEIDIELDDTDDDNNDDDDEVEASLFEEVVIPTIHKVKIKKLHKRGTHVLTEEQMNLHYARSNAKREESLHFSKHCLKGLDDYVVISFDREYISVLDFTPWGTDTIVTKSLYFDKNFNLLTDFNSDADTRHLSNLKKGPTYCPHYLLDHEYANRTVDRFVIVDFKRLIKSRGKEFYIRYKHLLDYKEIKKIRKQFINYFSNLDQLLTTLNSYVSSVFDQDHYDIIVNTDINFTTTDINFQILAQYDNLTIRNSIEIERYIGDMIVRFSGRYLNKTIFINHSLFGLRKSLSVEEVLSKYQHSHLPCDAGTNYYTFCLGNSYHMFSGLNGEITEMELQSIFYATQDYLQWESLEGGPHKRMEDITICQSPLGNDIKTIGPDKSHLTGYSRQTYINYILEDKENLFKIFKLVKSDTSFTFTFNEYDMYEYLGRKLKTDYTGNLTTSMFYDVKTKKFYRNNKNLNDWESAVNLCERDITKYLPLYMNGELIQPVLTTELVGEDPFINMLPVPYPNEMLMLGNTIVNILNEELKKDEYRKRQ